MTLFIVKYEVDHAGVLIADADQTVLNTSLEPKSNIVVALNGWINDIDNRLVGQYETAVE